MQPDYRLFMEVCSSDHFHFQICNHNLLLADAIHRGTGKRPLFPEYSGLIIDEAHKLPETARQMFGVTLASEDIRSLIHGLRVERYVLAAEQLTEAAKPLLRELSKPWEETRPISHYIRLLAGPEKTLTIIQKQLASLLSPVQRMKLDICRSSRPSTMARTTMTSWRRRSQACWTPPTATLWRCLPLTPPCPL